MPRQVIASIHGFAAFEGKMDGYCRLGPVGQVSGATMCYKAVLEPLITYNSRPACKLMWGEHRNAEERKSA